MMEQSDPEERKILARHARDLMDNFAFQRAVEDMNAEIVENLCVSNLEDKTIIMLGRRLQALTAVKSLLPVYVNNQKYAKKD